MSIQPLDIVIHLVNIFVLFLLLRLLVYGPVQKFMQQREDRIKSQLKSAGDAKAEADELKASFDAKLRDADQEVQQKLLDGTQRASDAAAVIAEQAQQQAQGIIDAAKQRADSERGQMLQSLQPQVTEMAISLAGEILKREVSPADNRSVIDTFFDKEVSA